MLETALLVAARRSQIEQEKRATAALLDQLPLEVLREIAETGEIKLAYGMCSPDGSPSGSWVDQFKGTPFFQQAIALEQEDLQAQTANQQSSAVQRQKMDQEYAMQDQIRLKKKLLELQKARNEAQVLDQGAGPPAQAGSPDPAGTAPGGPAGPVMEDLKTVTAGVKTALSGATLKSYAQKQTSPAGLASASKSLTGRGAQLIASGDAAAGVKKVNQGNFLAQKATAAVPQMPKAAMVVEGWAREMAREDAAKMAHAQEVFSVGDFAGRLMAKSASDTSDLISKGLGWAKKNPALAGAAVGATVNAGREALKHDSGVGDVVGAAATGGLAGHAVGGIGSKMIGPKGKDFGGALTSYARDTGKQLKSIGADKAE